MELGCFSYHIDYWDTVSGLLLKFTSSMLDVVLSLSGRDLAGLLWARPILACDWDILCCTLSLLQSAGHYNCRLALLTSHQSDASRCILTCSLVLTQTDSRQTSDRLTCSSPADSSSVQLNSRLVRHPSDLTNNRTKSTLKNSTAGAALLPDESISKIKF